MLQLLLVWILLSVFPRPEVKLLRSYGKFSLWEVWDPQVSFLFLFIESWKYTIYILFKMLLLTTSEEFLSHLNELKIVT